MMNRDGSLFLLDSLIAIGGSERKTVRIVNTLSKRGAPVHLGYLNSPDTLLKSVDSDVPVLKLCRRGKFDLRALRRLSDYIKENHIQRLFCVNLYPSLYGLISKSLVGNGRLLCFALINKHNFVPRLEEFKMLVYRPFLQNASHILFGCRNQKERWVKRYFLNEKRCSYIYNGVDCGWFSPKTYQDSGSGLRRNLGLLPSDVVIANVAAFLPKKRQDDLIQSCATLKDLGHSVHLLLAGDGPRRTRLVEKATNLGISPRVHFLGAVSDVRSVLSAADIFALSSVAENFSNAALEAMAMGKPVVLSRVGGSDEMVEEGKNGFLYPPGNIPALVAKLQSLVTDDQLRRDMGNRARRIAENRFSFEAMILKYEQLLEHPKVADCEWGDVLGEAH